MNNKDFRIGNLVYGVFKCPNTGVELKHACTIKLIDSIGKTKYPIWVDGIKETGLYDKIVPIPLDEKSLILFFDVRRATNYAVLTYVIDRYTISFVNNEKWYLNIGSKIIHIENVHTLQNVLYFMNNKKEIETKTN